MRIDKKKLLLIMLHIVCILFAYVFMKKINSYHKICVVGSIFVFLTISFNVVFEKKIITASNIILICFTLFQFGLPFLNALDASFESWYINQFSLPNLITSVRITVICIQFFALGLIVSEKINIKKYKVGVTQKGKSLIDDSNSLKIYNMAKILYFFCAIIAFPLVIYVDYIALKNGYSYIKTDRMNIYNGLTRFVQQMIIPSNFLLIIYSRTDKIKKFWKKLLIFYSILLLFTGARTVSLAIFMVLILLNKEENKNDGNFKKNIMVILTSFVILFIGVFIAKFRYDGSIISFSVVDTVEAVIEETGFNFTSLPFTQIFIPVSENYRYGMSYIFSIICLIPRTLDPFGYIDYCYSMLPEIWLEESLNSKFDDLYSFGVGYSVIAESYYNFGKYGFWIIFIQGFIIGSFINNYNERNKFSKYVKFIMLFSLLTYPRRSFTTLLKSIEYCVIFVIILIYVYVKANKKGDIEYESNSNMS